MRRILPFILSIIIFQSSVSANCSIQKMLRKKINTQVEQRNNLEESLELHAKLKEVNSWQEWTNVERADRNLSLKEAQEIFTVKEIDMLLLADTLQDQEGEAYKGMGVNIGFMAGSVAMSFITSRVINKLIDQGYKKGFMKKIQSLIGEDAENKRKAKKVKMVANIIAFAAPTYLVIKEIQLYNMLQGIQDKMEVVEDLNENLPELEILDERIQADKIMLRKFQSENSQKCD